MRICLSLLLCGVLLPAACGSPRPETASTEVAPDPARGRQIFHGHTVLTGEGAPSCATCHAIEPGEETGVGPNLADIGSRAATVVEGQSAEQYLRTAITDPDAYLAGGYQEGIMYRQYEQVLTEQQIDDLVAYLLTLKGGQE